MSHTLNSMFEKYGDKMPKNGDKMPTLGASKRNADIANIFKFAEFASLKLDTFEF